MKECERERSQLN